MKTTCKFTSKLFCYAVQLFYGLTRKPLSGYHLLAQMKMILLPSSVRG